MNFETIKTGFLQYLESLNSTDLKPGKEDSEEISRQLPPGEISIFLYSDEFKEYLVDEVGADESIFSKSINEIMNMEFVNGQLVEPQDTNTDTFEHSQDIQLTGDEAGQGNNLSADYFDMLARNNQNNSNPIEQMAGLNKAIDDNANMAPETNAMGSDLMKNMLNGVFSNEQMIQALDFDSTGDLSANEVAIFLKGVMKEDENNQLTFEGVSKAVKNIISPEEETTQTVDKEKEGTVQNLLNKIYENATVIKALDIDKDGKLSDEEKAKFEEYLKENMSDSKELTPQAIKDAFDKIMDGSFSYEQTAEDIKAEKEKVTAAENPEAAAESQAQKEASAANSSGGSGGASGVGGSGGAGGVGGSGGGAGGGGSVSGGSGTSLGDLSTQVKGKTLDELKVEKNQKTTDYNTAREEVNKVLDGTNSEVKAAEDQCKQDEEAYKDAVKNDDKVSDELKTSLEKVLKDISTSEDAVDEYEKSINNYDAEIDLNNSEIDVSKSNISSIDAAIQELDNSANADGVSEEQKTKISEKKAELEQQKSDEEAKVSDAQSKVDTANTSKTQAQENLTKTQTDLENFKKQKEEIEKQISETCKPETKQAMDKYNQSKEAAEKVKTEQRDAANAKVNTAKEALDKVNEEIKTKEAEEIKSKSSVGGNFDLSDIELNLSAQQQSDMEAFKSNYQKNKDKYEKVAQATGMPPELIAAIHWREGSGDFTTYLHNGEKLGHTTTLVPAGIYFEDWTEAAIDAINREKSKVDTSSGSTESYLEFAEAYNGWGYRNRGVVSPYVYAGTTKYTGGKYVRDGVYDPNHVDQQLGVAAMLKALSEAGL